MPKLIGNIQFTGSLDNMSAYKMRGSDKIILRTKGGATKEKIKKDPAFALTRQNNMEFGGCSKAGTSIRRALAMLMHLSDTRISGQLNALARIILKLDTLNERGQRAISFSQHRYLLDGFSLNRQLLFNSIIRHPVSCTLFRNNGAANLVLPGLIPGVNFYTPPQYHLYRFIIVLGVIPDIVYTPTGYRPANPIQNNPNYIFTEWHAVNEPVPEQSFDLQLENFTGLGDSNSLVLALGIEFGYPMSNNITKAIKYAGCATILATG